MEIGGEIYKLCGNTGEYASLAWGGGRPCPEALPTPVHPNKNRVRSETVEVAENNCKTEQTILKCNSLVRNFKLNCSNHKVFLH